MSRRLCAAPGCERPAAPKKRICHQCKYAAAKARDGQRVAYHFLKSNAKRRGIPFDITLDDFREFCVETDILAGRGRTSSSWHIDRIIDALGYTRGNLQKLTNAENLAKEIERRRKVKKYDYELAARRRLGAYESAEHAADDEGRNVFYYQTNGGGPNTSEAAPDDDVPF